MLASQNHAEGNMTLTMTILEINLQKDSICSSCIMLAVDLEENSDYFTG